LAEKEAMACPEDIAVFPVFHSVFMCGKEAGNRRGHAELKKHEIPRDLQDKSPKTELLFGEEVKGERD
jgi:hypothetical protein